MVNTKLFISHSADDMPLIKAFVDLVEGGIGVPPRDIFCSTLKGQGIRPGTDFKSSIREQLDEATCVVALISPNFYGSAFCMCELGGTWVQAKSFLPMLVPPLEFGDLKAVLDGLQAGKIAESADLDELRDEIAERLKLSPLSTPRWTDRRDTFLKILPKILKRLPDVTPVPRALYEKVLKKFADYKTEYKEMEIELAKLKAINVDLLKIKNPRKTASVIRKHSNEIDNFELLVRTVKLSLKPLPRCVREAIYQHTRGEDYYPKSREDWDDVQRPIENGQLLLNDNETGVSISSKNPKVIKALTAIDELEQWLEESNTEFVEWYIVEHEGESPDLKLRQFWQTHLW